jgi:LPXTG-motif cell wall-anchored protein
VCIASGLNPGEVTEVTSGSGSPGTLPRTGPAPLAPTVLVGGGLLLIGLVAALAGRRRTARI